MHVVKSRPDLDILEERHSEDGEDEHDKKEEEGDVDEGGEGHDQGEEQGADPLSALDQTQDTANLGHSNLRENNLFL